MEVDGMNATRDAYRIRFQAQGRTIFGLVPEALVAADLGREGRPRHEEVYRWIDANRSAIEAALCARALGGRRPRAPFDQLALSEEN